jgi:hypothetical protein
MIPHILKTANFTVANALHHHEFLALLLETESEHGEGIYHINMRWLNRGSITEEVNDKRYINKLQSLVDVRNILDTIKKGLKSKDMLSAEMCDSTAAFKVKLQLWKKQKCAALLTLLT